ncbi:tellurite resistance TerB family protein [Spirosoma aerophilum]
MDTNDVNIGPGEPADLYLGLGNLVYALAKVDGRIQSEETQLARQLLGEQPHGDLALHAFFLLEDCNVPVEDAYAFAMRRFVNNKKVLTAPTKKQFVDILVRIADAYEETSRKEQEFIKRFRRDIRRL